MGASALHDAVVAVAPITGVSVGHWDDRATWRIDFKDEATAEQRDAARVVAAAFDIRSKPERPAQRDLAAELDALKGSVDAVRSTLVKKGVATDAEIAAAAKPQAVKGTPK